MLQHNIILAIFVITTTVILYFQAVHFTTRLSWRMTPRRYMDNRDQRFCLL